MNENIDAESNEFPRVLKTYGYMPSPRDLGGFKFLFAPRDKDWLEEHGLNFQCNGDEPLDVENAFFTTPPPHWVSFEELLDEVRSELEAEKQN